jgi:GDPmannose 4,6-dehydratase
MPRALITGITGQDGSYLAELLLEKGYEVHGLVRRTSTLARSRVDHLYRDPSIYGTQLHFHYAELEDSTTVRRLFLRVQPDEVYHLAGQSHVGLSFEIPESTCEMTAMGTLRLLEILRDMPQPPRFFHASSSEIFGQPSESPQTEQTPHAPVTPYGCAKAFATQLVRVYRRSFNLFAANGILYNHESPRRGQHFITRKICRAAAAIHLGRQQDLALGDLTAQRDWGDAREYVRGMWLTLQHGEPDDFIFATGQLHSVQDVLEVAFGAANLDWRAYVRHDPRFVRRLEPAQLVGNAAKARQILGWTPQTSFATLIREMTQSEIARLAAGQDDPA